MHINIFIEVYEYQIILCFIFSLPSKIYFLLPLLTFDDIKNDEEEEHKEARAVKPYSVLVLLCFTILLLFLGLRRIIFWQFISHS